WYAFHLLMEGRFDEAIERVLRTRELDPISPSVLQAVAWCYYQARRFDESIATYKSMLEAVPEFPYGLITQSWTLRHTGHVNEAVKAAEKALDLSGGGTFYIAALGAAYAAAGRKKDAQAVLERLAQLSVHGYVSPYQLSLIYLHLGERGRALELLQDAYTIRDAWVVWLGVEPQFDPLRGDPIFEGILRDLRHPALYRKAEKKTAPKKRRKP